MHLKSDNVEIMINDESDAAIKNFLINSKIVIKINLESMKCVEFAFGHVHLLYDKCHKINPNHGESYLDSPDWIKSKKAAINSINKKDSKCFMQ